jgi:hypothetical protein
VCVSIITQILTTKPGLVKKQAVPDLKANVAADWLFRLKMQRPFRENLWLELEKMLASPR